VLWRVLDWQSRHHNGSSEKRLHSGHGYAREFFDEIIRPLLDSIANAKVRAEIEREVRIGLDIEENIPAGACVACGGLGQIIIGDTAYGCHSCLGEGSIRDRLARIGLPERLQGCSFGNFRQRSEYPTVAAAKREAEEFVAGWHPGHCLILQGTPGVGKTHLASAVLRALCERGQKCRFLEVPMWLQEVQDSYKTGETTQLLRDAREVDVLLLDDFGAERQTEDRLDKLGLVLRGRHDDAVTTIVTTNLDSLQLASIQGGRLASRLLESSRVIEIEAGDFRAEHRTGADTSWPFAEGAA